MSDKKLKNDQTKEVQLDGVEIAVLKALEKLGKEQGKSFLTEEQEERLRKAGRTADEGASERAMGEEKAGSIKMISREDAVRSSFRIVQDMLMGTEKYRTKYYSDEAWDSYDEKGKKFARGEMFEKMYGMMPREFGYSIYRNIVGTTAGRHE